MERSDLQKEFKDKHYKPVRRECPDDWYVAWLEDEVIRLRAMERNTLHGLAYAIRHVYGDKTPAVEPEKLYCMGHLNCQHRDGELCRKIFGCAHQSTIPKHDYDKSDITWGDLVLICEHCLRFGGCDNAILCNSKVNPKIKSCDITQCKHNQNLICEQGPNYHCQFKREYHD